MIWAANRAVSVLNTTPTRPITRKVNRYWVSETASEKLGGTKNQSKAATLKTAAKIAAPRSPLSDTNTSPNKKIMIKLGSSRWCQNSRPSKVAAIRTPADQP
ncbi:hypothetical protein D3C72_669760 [compost metagenome]